MTSRLKEKFEKENLKELKEKLNLKNINEVPHLKKVVVNMGVGEATVDIKELDDAVKELGLLSGQKAIINRARRSVANFKIREGMPIGCKVTLRHDRMYEFLDRLINIALPRVKDFRGLHPRSFDGKGNYSFGVDDQTIFPEISADKIKKFRGMDITIVTSSKNDKGAFELLKSFGFPFRKLDLK